MDIIDILTVVNTVLLAVIVVLVVLRDFWRKQSSPEINFAPLLSEFDRMKTDNLTTAKNQREELNSILSANANSANQQLQLLRDEFEKRLAGIRESNSQNLEEVRRTLDEKLNENSVAIASLSEENTKHQLAAFEGNSKAQDQLRTKLAEELERLRRSNEEKLEQMRATIEEKLKENTVAIASLSEENTKHQLAAFEGNSKAQDQLRTKLAEELERLRRSNEEKLEQMRATVDEKLQGTLEKRLGESFKQVSGQLEQVQRGLGEMQNLASDVGGLKRVLTNVKNRGSWGEVQLSRQLEDLLTPEQFLSNAKVKPGAETMVEFAVKLPGREEGEHVLLAIDSKFPQENYERLLQAQEVGDPEQIEAAARAIERDIRVQAKQISEKYIAPPHTTDFAIMYLPTEGLFAEVIRRPGLASQLQSQFRIVVTGPTTLASLLNSLQMGFRTLAIEKRTSDVWKILSSAKEEFRKYGEVWDRLQKQLKTAQNTVSDAGTRTRAIERQLRNVELDVNPELVGQRDSLNLGSSETSGSGGITS